MNEWTTRFISSLEALKETILKFDDKDLLPGVVVIVAQTLYQLIQLTTEILSDQRYSLDSIRLCLSCGSAGDTVVVTWDEFINEFSSRFDAKAEAGVFSDGIVKFPSVSEHLDYVTKNIDDRIRSLTKDSSNGIKDTDAITLPSSGISDGELKPEPSEDQKTRSDVDSLSDKDAIGHDSESSDTVPMQGGCMPLVDHIDPLLKKHIYEQFSRISPNMIFPAQLQMGRYEGDSLNPVSLRCFLCSVPDTVYSSFESLSQHIVTNHASPDDDGRMVVLCPRNSAGCNWFEPVRSTLSGSVLERVINHVLIEHKMAIPDLMCNFQPENPFNERRFCQPDDPTANSLKHAMNKQYTYHDCDPGSEPRSSGSFQSLCNDSALASTSCLVQSRGKTFGSKISLKKRVKLSKDQTKIKFTCSHCPKSFSQKYKYYRHVFSHHSDRASLEDCKVCHFDVTELQLLAKLFNSMTEMSPVTLKISSSTDGSQAKTVASEDGTSALSGHCTIQSQEDAQDNEDDAEMSDDQPDNLNQSRDTVSSVKKIKLDEDVEQNKNNSNTIHFTRYQCFLCVSSVDVFETSGALFTHVRNTHVQNDGQVNTIECPYCTEAKVVQKGVGSYILSQVLSHMVKKHRIGIPDYIKPFYCPEPNCHFLSIRRYELNTHAQKHLTSDVKVPCEKCGKFMQQRSLGLHAKFCSASTVDREMFKCTVCSKLISTKQGLQKHFQNKHENRKNFLCSHCTKAFSGKGELEDHAFRRHGANISNKPVYNCAQCTFKTILSFSLKRHISEAHSTTKQHQCLVCNKFFKSPMQLKSHKVAHEERTHHCSMCDYTAARKSNLDAHVKAQHSGVQYRCEKCGYQTGYYANLCKHQRTTCGHQNK